MRGYDSWKTATPYEDGDQVQCLVCDRIIDGNTDSPRRSEIEDGMYCSSSCEERAEHEHYGCDMCDAGEYCEVMEEDENHHTLQDS